MAFLATRFTPSAQKSGAAKTLSSSQGVCGGLGGCLVSGRQPGSGARLCRPVAPHLARCIGGSVNRLCSGGSTRNILPARVPLLSVPPPGSPRGCRPSPLATVVAVVLVSGSGVLGVGGVFSCFFPRCQEAGGTSCAGPRGPGPVRQLAATGGLAVAVYRAAISRAPAQFSSTQEKEPPRGNTGNKLLRPPPEGKHPGNPVQTPLPPLPRRAGSRRALSWRSLRAAMPAGTDASAALLLRALLVC